MIVHVLGCSGSIAAGARTTSFLLDGDVLVDAGTGVGDLPLEAMAAVDHILVTHSHLDHVLAIGLLADSVMRLRTAAGRPPVQVHALQPTLDALRTHLFNGVIWPDFTRLPSREQPMLALVPFAVGDVLSVAGKTIEVLPAAHTVPACGFAARDAGSEGGWWVFTGDTGPNPALWARLARMDVATLVIETAFADEEAELARLSRHLCPALLGAELEQLRGSVDVRITHVKPGEEEAVMREVAALATPHRVRVLRKGDALETRAPARVHDVSPAT
jgi:ribonuclease BN (tRNA processing enzyme)